MPRKNGKRKLALLLVSFVIANSINIPGHFSSRPISLIFKSEAAPIISAEQPTSTSDKIDREQVSEAYAKLPLSFEANNGQTDKQVKFLSRGNGFNLFLTLNEAVFSLTKSAAKERVDVLKLKFIGANLEPQVTAEGKLPGKSNYYIGNNPKQWHSNIANYAKVKYDDIYPGIDIVYYGNGHQLEYDFIIAAGADPGRIKFSVEGTQMMRLDERGDLVLTSGAGEIRQHKPFIYQEMNGVKHEVSGKYVLCAKRQVRFMVGEYDKNRPLVIDPVLAYSTHLGGSSADLARDIAVDMSGNAYVTGQTSSLDFPANSDTVQPTFGGGQDIFVTKFNPTGSAIVYSTYLGGDNVEAGQGIDVDLNGSAYVTGRTVSTNFPITAGAVQPTFGGGGQDGFVTKLNPTCSALVYSTYLGGLDVDISQDIEVRFGSVYVTGSTESSNFPTTTGAAQTTFGGIQDAFITKLNETGTALVYSTYLGGSDADSGFGIVVRNDSAYVAGNTSSVNFPTTTGAVQPTFGGTQDAFVTKLNETGSGLSFSTYLGGSGGDTGQDIAVNRLGNVFVTGNTNSANFPTTPGVFQPIRVGLSDAFITKLNESGSALVFSTYLGGSGADTANAIVVRLGRAIVTGSTTSSNFPTTADAVQIAHGGGQDAFITRLNETGSALIFSTFLGGNDADAGHGIAIRFGNAYVAGSTSSLNFPVTTGAFQGTSAGGSDAFVARIGWSQD